MLRLAAVGCFVLVLSNRLCRRLPHLRFRDNQNHHCFAHRNRLLFIVAHVFGASAAASSFRNFVHLSRPPFVEYIQGLLPTFSSYSSSSFIIDPFLKDAMSPPLQKTDQKAPHLTRKKGGEPPLPFQLTHEVKRCRQTPLRTHQDPASIPTSA